MSKFARNFEEEMLQKEERPFTVFVEGNIGSGKTSLLNYFSKSDYMILSEPVDQWRSVGKQKHNLLDLMYENPIKWGMTFQMYVFKTLLENHLAPTTMNAKLMERSLFSSRYCFVETLHNEEFLSPPEYSVLDEWFTWMLSKFNIKGDLIIYLRTDPDIAYKRVKERNRSEEQNISLDYLTKLHSVHENWIMQGLYDSSTQVHCIDANQGLVRMQQEYKICENVILDQIGMRA